MPDENPAAEAVATTNAETVETPVSAPATAVAEPASAPVEPSPAQPSKPDVASLLSDPEYRKELLRHPDIAREIDHRASSEAGRRAKAEVEKWQQQQQARQERERLLQMDETELGEHYKQRLTQEEQDAAFEARVQARLGEIHPQLLRQAGEEIFGSAHELAKEAGATDEELAQLNPQNYGSLKEYFKGAVQFFATREGKKLAKEMAKVEAKAMVEAQHAKVRESSPAAEVLPPAEPAQSDDDFTAAYASGNSKDTARQLKWMRDRGIPV